MLNFSERYRACKEAIREMSLNTPHKIWIALASIALSVLIGIGPIILLVNCFIFNDYMNLVLIGILFFVYLIIYFSRVFYYKTITKKQIEDMKIFYLADAGICAIGLCIGIFIGLFI